MTVRAVCKVELFPSNPFPTIVEQIRSTLKKRKNSRTACKSSRNSIKHIFSSRRRETTRPGSQCIHRDLAADRDQFLYLYIEHEIYRSPSYQSDPSQTFVAHDRRRSRKTNELHSVADYRRRKKKERERERSKGVVTDTNGFGSNASANDDERGL